ncbi:TPA: hypothetical protein HA335_03335 [Methanocaldococcus jannaschii]|nr:hypothetical protein [Methanocaldococcus jannaschii]HII59604.1 hypothetical protein [Methanocaldococcus jannaschii]
MKRILIFFILFLLFCGSLKAHLIFYDKDVSQLKSLGFIGDYNGKYWLISDKCKLIKYNEIPILIVPSKPLNNIEIIKWDKYRESWLIITNNESISNVSSDIYLLEGKKLIHFGRFNFLIEDIDDNGDYFLVSAFCPDKKSKIFIIYNNKSIEDINKYLNIKIDDFSFPKIKYIPNGNFWLIVTTTLEGQNCLIKFNGTYGEDISPKLNIPKPPNKMGCYNIIEDVDFNGTSYLIVGKFSKYKDRCNYILSYENNRSKIYKYNFDGHFKRVSWINNSWIVEIVNFSRDNSYSYEYYALKNGKLKRIKVGESANFTPIVWYLGTYITDIAKINDNQYLITLKSIEDFPKYPNIGALIKLTINNSKIDKKIIYKGKGLTSIGYNGKYCLIGGKGVLLLYNGKNITDLTKRANISNSDLISSIAYGKDCWLIGLDEVNLHYPSKSLIKFDGKKFYDLTNISNITICKILKSNKEYILIGTKNVLIKYNGSFITIINYTNYEKYGLCYIFEAMDYNPKERYWLVGGVCLYNHPYSSDAILYKVYDNGSYESLPINDNLHKIYGDFGFALVSLIKYIPKNNSFLIKVWVGLNDHWLIYKNNTLTEFVTQKNPGSIEIDNYTLYIFNYYNTIEIYDNNKLLSTVELIDIPKETVCVEEYHYKEKSSYNNYLYILIFIILTIIAIYIVVKINKKLT